MSDQNNNSQIPADSGDIQSGVVHASNESRFNAANYSDSLTAFTTGWKDPENLAGLLEYIAPSVPVARRFEFKKADNAESFLSESDDIRSIGSAFKRVEYTGETVNEKTYNKGLTIRVDHDEAHGDDWRERYTHLLMQRLFRNELRRAVGLLDASAKHTAATWDAASNPDADLRKAIIESANQTGIRPNRILFGEGAWDARALAYETKENASSIRSADMAPADIARKLLTDDVRVLRARYQAGNVKERMCENGVYAFFASDAITKDEPSNLKRFITPSAEGNNFRVYLEESAKYTDISVEHYSNIVLTSDIGVQKVEVSAS